MTRFTHPTVLERAFELARSGAYRELDEIEAALRKEGYYSQHLDGPLLRRQLRDAIAASRSAPERPATSN
jgi:hypothetical protein